jgi:hypothetical protein
MDPGPRVREKVKSLRFVSGALQCPPEVLTQTGFSACIGRNMRSHFSWVVRAFAWRDPEKKCIRLRKAVSDSSGAPRYTLQSHADAVAAGNAPYSFKDQAGFGLAGSQFSNSCSAKVNLRGALRSWKIPVIRPGHTSLGVPEASSRDLTLQHTPTQSNNDTS